MSEKDNFCQGCDDSEWFGRVMTTLLENVERLQSFYASEEQSKELHRGAAIAQALAIAIKFNEE